MKKKWGKLSLTLVLAAGLLAACGNNNTETGSGNAGTTPAKAEQIIMGTSADFPPYEFHAIIDGKDQIVGFDIEIAKEIAADMGKELVIKDMNFDSLLNELNSGRVDFVISGMNPTPERQESVDFSDIYYTGEQAIVTKEENKDKFNTMETLEGAKIGVQKSSIQEEIGQAIPNAQLTSLSKITDIMMQLNSGRVDAAIMEKPVAESFVKNMPGLAITDATPETDVEGYAIGIKKGNTELTEQINKTLTRLKEENKIEQFVSEASELADKSTADE